jgi:uncharacterized protein (TIRG00374 family)
LDSSAPTSDASQSNPSSTDSAQLASGLTRKIVLAMLLAAIVFGALALYADVNKLKQTAATFAPSAFVLGLSLAAGNYGLRILRWHYYLGRVGVSVPAGESSIVFLAAFVMSVTPGKVGEVFKSLLLYESRAVPIERTAPIVVAERLTDLIALVMLITLGAFSFEHGVFVAAASAALVAGLILVCAYRPLGHFLLRLTDKLRLLKRISPKLHAAYDALLEMTRPMPLIVGSGLAFLAWGLECGSLYVIVSGFPGVHLAWDAAVFAYSAATLAGALAMMPGGLGGTEAVMIMLLGTLGKPAVTTPIAIATTTLVRIATLWFAVVIGVLALGVYRAMERRRTAPARLPT